MKLLKRWTNAGKKFRLLWKYYLFQSALAASVTAVIFWILTLKDAVIVASLGATAFIMFAAPSSPPAHTVRGIGGQMIGCVCGALGILLLNSWSVSPVIVYSLMIGLTFFLMVTLDLYHPPAAGTALGLAISESYSKALITVVAAVVLLSIARRLLKKYLKDLA